MSMFESGERRVDLAISQGSSASLSWLWLVARSWCSSHKDKGRWGVGKGSLLVPSPASAVIDRLVQYLAFVVTVRERGVYHLCL